MQTASSIIKHAAYERNAISYRNQYQFVRRIRLMKEMQYKSNAVPIYEKNQTSKMLMTLILHCSWKLYVPDG
jgi:hypothetical protein